DVALLLRNVLLLIDHVVPTVVDLLLCLLQLRCGFFRLALLAASRAGERERRCESENKSTHCISPCCPGVLQRRCPGSRAIRIETRVRAAHARALTARLSSMRDNRVRTLTRREDASSPTARCGPTRPDRSRSRTR